MASVATAAMLVGCGGAAPSASATPAAAQTIETTTFSPEFAIDLRQFTRSTSGLYYLDALRGSGVVAAEGRKVTFRYVASLPDGTAVDVQRAPVEVELGPAMIRGLREGMTGMRVGGQRRLIVPPSLGYGRTMYRNIPPNSTLVFEVELLGVR